MKEADALLLLIPTANGLGNTVLSGKIFEYLAAERPVVGLVPTARRRRRPAALDRVRLDRRSR